MQGNQIFPAKARNPRKEMRIEPHGRFRIWNSDELGEKPYLSWSPALRLLQIGAHEADEVLSQFFGRLGSAVGMGNVQANVIFKDLRHETVYSTTDRRQQHEYIDAFVASVADRSTASI